MPAMTNDRAFTFYRSRLVAEAWLTNLLDACALPYAFGPRPASRAGTAVCVGAGPSLERTGPELARMQAAGALIATVNTALPAVARYCTPDVVLVRETVDVSSHLAHPAHLRVLDLGASPAVWDAAMAPMREREAASRAAVERAAADGYAGVALPDRCPEVAWFVPGSTNTFELALTLGVRPLFAGPAALTALVALVEEIGRAHV